MLLFLVSLIYFTLKKDEYAPSDPYKNTLGLGKTMPNNFATAHLWDAYGAIIGIKIN